MEFFLGIIVLIGAIFLTFRLGQSGDSSGPSQTLPQSKRKSPKKIKAAKPSQFDENSARHLNHSHILTGAAYVTDGDTIKIKNTQIRLFGIDAPELNHPYGRTNLVRFR